MYRPVTTKAKLGYLIEEAGGVLAAAGKSLRFGLNFYNPDVPYGHRETNQAWLLRELKDLKNAIEIIESELG